MLANKSEEIFRMLGVTTVVYLGGQEYYCLWRENLIKARVVNQIKLSLSNKILCFNEDDGFKKYYIFIEG